MNQETSLKDWLGATTSFGYDNAGRLNSITLPNGITESTVYDNDSQVSTITDKEGSTTLASFNYTSPTPRNADEELMSETDTGTPSPTTQSYSYDTLKRVTADNSSSYGYNYASQLTTGPGGASQFFDPAGQLCWSKASPPQGSTCSSAPSGATTYTFNQEAQRTATTSSSSSSTYAWNQHEELTSTTTGSTTVGYTYNAAGLLAKRTQGSPSVYFVWDSVQAAVPLLVDDGTNYYIYGPDGLPTEQISVSSGTPDYYLHDQLGSTRLLTNSSGTVVASWTFNAWGATVATTGSATATPMLWAGQYFDSVTGLYYMRARWYDPNTGELLSVDPDFNATLNAYGYANENPVSGVDPSGLMISELGGGAYGATTCQLKGSVCQTQSAALTKATTTKPNTEQAAQSQVATSVNTAVAAENKAVAADNSGNSAAMAKANASLATADAAVETAANHAATVALSNNPAPNSGPTVDCASHGQGLDRSQLANAEIIFAAATDAGLSDNEAEQMVAASCQESGFNASVVNGIGATGLFQLMGGYQTTAEQLGGVTNPLANTEAILPEYVAYWNGTSNYTPDYCGGEPSSAEGVAACSTERSGSSPSWYAAPLPWISGYFATKEA